MSRWVGGACTLDGHYGQHTSGIRRVGGWVAAGAHLWQPRMLCSMGRQGSGHPASPGTCSLAPPWPPTSTVTHQRSQDGPATRSTAPNLPLSPTRILLELVHQALSGGGRGAAVDADVPAKRVGGAGGVTLSALACASNREALGRACARAACLAACCPALTSESLPPTSPGTHWQPLCRLHVCSMASSRLVWCCFGVGGVGD